MTAVLSFYPPPSLTYIMGRPSTLHTTVCNLQDKKKIVENFAKGAYKRSVRSKLIALSLVVGWWWSFLKFCSRIEKTKALFIIRYEGHVDLVTAHKPHFEIVETRGLATVLASKLTLGLFLLKNSDWDFERLFIWYTGVFGAFETELTYVCARTFLLLWSPKVCFF